MEYKKFLSDYKYLEELEKLHERKVNLRKELLGGKFDPFLFFNLFVDIL